MINNSLFRGRKLVIATMHGKEQVIAPILKEALDVDIVIPQNFNTDVYGTFAGEIERKANPVESARIKCIAACELTQCDLAIASEGSFGPHPTLYFIPGNEEIIFLLDRKNDLEIIARELTSNTNFNGEQLKDWTAAQQFAEQAKFPTHGLIIRKEEKDTQHLLKGIKDWETLKKHFDEYIEKYGAAFLETDMRAMHNPTRMTVIETATKKLIEKINNTCPSCQTPGFDVKEAVSGLPCNLCGAPTRSSLAVIYECKRCGYQKRLMYPNGKSFEEPMYCDYCNP